MSILSFIRKTAQHAAKEGLEKLEAIATSFQENEKKDSQSMVDNYRNMLEQSEQPVCPVPDSLRPTLREEAESYCANQSVFMDIYNAWCENRISFFPDIELTKDIDLERARKELHVLLKKYGYIQSINGGSEQWLSPLQNIAQHQNRPVYNLLLQANAQIEETQFTSWMNEMNARLSRFHLKILPLEENSVTLVSIS